MRILVPAFLGCALCAAGFAAKGKPVRVLFWSEQTEPREVYPHGISGALEEHFKTVFQKGALPEDMEQIVVQGEPTLVDFIAAHGLVKSKSEARRLIQQSGVKLDGHTVNDSFLYGTTNRGVVGSLESSSSSASSTPRPRPAVVSFTFTTPLPPAAMIPARGSYDSHRNPLAQETALSSRRRMSADRNGRRPL